MLKPELATIPTVLFATEETAQKADRIFHSVIKNFLSVPILEVKPIISNDAFKRSIDALPEMDFVIFSSPTAVKVFNDLCEASKTRFYFGNIKVIATGDKTANTCRAHYIDVDCLPKVFSAAGIVKMLEQMEISNKNFLIPRSAKAGSFLPDEIRKLGAEVYTIDTYTVEPPNAQELRVWQNKISQLNPDLYIFTSPSAFEYAMDTVCCSDLKNITDRKFFAAIGDKTAATLVKAGVKSVIIPDTYTIEGLYYKLKEIFPHV